MPRRYHSRSFESRMGIPQDGIQRWQPAGRPDPPDGPDSHGPDRSRLVLALGLVSLVIAPLGVIAWVAGNACLRAIAEGRMDPIGEANARAGRLLGIIATCMFAVKLAALVPFLAGVFG